MRNYVNDLIRINQRVLNYSLPGGYRTDDVVCVARTGQKVRFAPHAVVPGSMELLINKFTTLLEESKDLEKFAYALSFFWLGFIAIHPFPNGNGRTGKEFLSLMAKEKNLSISSIADLDKILLTGNLNQDLPQLQHIFINSLKPGSL